MSSKLFVGNLAFTTTENELRDIFSAHGTVSEVFVAMDKFTGRPRGFYQKFKLSRIALRELASAGQIPGVVKSSW